MSEQIDDPSSRKLQLELRKLELEINDLQRPLWQKPTSLAAIVSFVVGVGTALVLYNKGYFDLMTERLRLQEQQQSLNDKLLKRQERDLQDAIKNNQDAIRQSNLDRDAAVKAKQLAEGQAARVAAELDTNRKALASLQTEASDQRRMNAELVARSRTLESKIEIAEVQQRRLTTELNTATERVASTDKQFRIALARKLAADANREHFDQRRDEARFLALHAAWATAGTAKPFLTEEAVGALFLALNPEQIRHAVRIEGETTSFAVIRNGTAALLLRPDGKYEQFGLNANGSSLGPTHLPAIQRSSCDLHVRTCVALNGGNLHLLADPHREQEAEEERSVSVSMFEKALIDDQADGVSALAIAANGSRAAYANETEIRTWSRADNRLQRVASDMRVTDLAVSTGECVLALDSKQSMARIYCNTAAHLESVWSDSAAIAIASHPLRPQFAIARSNGTIVIWDEAERRTSLTFRHESAGVSALAFSPNDAYLAVAELPPEGDGIPAIVVALLDPKTGEEISTLGGGWGEGIMKPIVFSADSKTLVALYAKTVRSALVWDVARREDLPFIQATFDTLRKAPMTEYKLTTVTVDWPRLVQLAKYFGPPLTDDQCRRYMGSACPALP